MPTVPPPDASAAAARPPVLPPAGAGRNKNRGGAAAAPVHPAPPSDRGAGGTTGRPRGGPRGPVFNWNQERLAALVRVIAVDGVKTAAQVHERLKAHPEFADEAHLLKRESILRWVSVLQDQYIEVGRPDLAARLELRKSGSAWRPDLDALAAEMEGAGGTVEG